MQQSRLMSLAESVTNAVVGYVQAIATRDSSCSRGSASRPGLPIT